MDSKMFLLLRLIFWIAALLFAAAPLALEVVTSPEHLSTLFEANSYLPFGRNLIFLAITILAIGLIDALESILLFARSAHDHRKKRHFCIHLPVSGFYFLSALHVLLLVGASAGHSRLHRGGALFGFKSPHRPRYLRG